MNDTDAHDPHDTRRKLLMFVVFPILTQLFAALMLPVIWIAGDAVGEANALYWPVVISGFLLAFLVGVSGAAAVCWRLWPAEQ